MKEISGKSGWINLFFTGDIITRIKVILNLFTSYAIDIIIIMILAR